MPRKQTSPREPKRPTVSPSTADSGPGAASSKTASSEDGEAELPDEVLEFVCAIDHFKRAQSRPFPSWSEVLQVLKQLGYERRAS